MGVSSRIYDMSALFKKAKWTFALSEDELLYLRNQLNETNNCSWKDDALHKIHNGIAAFGLCSEPTEENIALIEKFINRNTFCDSVTAAALKVLCDSNYWNLANQYEGLLCEYISLDDDMYDESIRAAVISMAHYCHATKHKKYITLLYSLFDKALNNDEAGEEFLPDIETLYNSLEIIMWGDHYPRGRRVTFGDMKIPQDFNPEVIEWIKSLIDY